MVSESSSIICRNQRLSIVGACKTNFIYPSFLCPNISENDLFHLLAEHLTDLPDGPEIAAWYRDVDALRTRRNEMIHSGWAFEWTGDEWTPSRVRMVTKKGKVSLEQTITSADDIKALVDEASAALRRIPRQSN